MTRVARRPATRSTRDAGAPVATRSPASSDAGAVRARTRRPAAVADGMDASRPTAAPELHDPNTHAAQIQRALLADHATLRAANPAGFEAKMAKLASSPFVFFRGTAGLFYRGLAGTDAGLPRVLVNGDVHPENFGVMRSADGGLVFGLDDFDEAFVAPFSWDLKRGALGFELAARERGFAARTRTAIHHAFVDSYFDALAAFKGNKGENRAQITAADPPAVLAGLFAQAAGSARAKFLGKYVKDGQFKRKSDLTPLSDRRGEFAAHLKAYRKTLGEGAPDAGSYYQVKDVAERHGSGTASQGLQRYWVLIEGPTAAPEDDVILELKETGGSTLEPYVPRHSLDLRLPGPRVNLARQVQLVGGDAFYGHVKLDGRAFVVRERSPSHAKVELAQLDARELRAYAAVCGRVLAQAHARADKDTGLSRHSAEKRILAAVDPEEYAGQLATFTREAADRIVADHSTFVALRDAGAL